MSPLKLQSLHGKVEDPILFVFKVMFRKTGYIYGKVYMTGWHFMDFPMPQMGDFELLVRGRYEGGDGPVRMISIKGKAGKYKYIYNTLCPLGPCVSCCFFFLR